MPVKDLLGRPKLTGEERALISAIYRRLGLPPPNRSGRSDDDGLATASPAPGPRNGPGPLTGAATVD